MTKIPYQQAEIIGGVDPTQSELRSGFMYYDALKTIFWGQRELMDRYHDIEEKNGGQVVHSQDLGDIQSRRVQLRIHELYGHLVRELSEAMAELQASKSWKTAPREVDPAKFTEEMADSLHFFVEMCITAGIGPEQIFNAYFAAWDKNKARQADGY